MEPGDRSLLILATGSLIAAGILLLKPISATEHMWAVSVGSTMTGVNQVTPKSMGPLRAFSSGQPFMNRKTKQHLIGGLTCAGVGLGAGLALIGRRTAG